MKISATGPVRLALNLLAGAFTLAGLTSASAQTPVITTQPQSTNAVLGRAAAFAVSATTTNPPLGYQWRKESLPISGATGSALALAGVKYTDAGIYSVLVSNTNGIVASSNATLTVVPPVGGELDLAFNPGAGANGPVYSIAVQPNGKVLIGGSFSYVNGTVRGNFAELNADGSLDTSFNPSFDFAVRAIALQPDGKVLLGGDFMWINGTYLNGVGRLYPNGTVDMTFNPQGGANHGVVYALGLQPDGKVLIGGSFDAVNSVPCDRIARLNADGSLDTSFNSTSPLGGINNLVRSLAVQSDGKALIGGDFTSVGIYPWYRIARVGTNGVVDLNFNFGPAGANNSVRAAVVQPDGKVLIGGAFTTFNGTSRNHIARLYSNGSLDATFQNGVSGVDGTVNCLAVQADGKVMIGGSFTNVNGLTRYRIARLNADGSLDSTFQNALGGADGTVETLAVQADGKVLIAGSFTNVNGVARYRIARLYGAADTYDTADAGDADGDGLSNAWERQHGLNPESPNRQLSTGRDGALSVETGDTYTDDVWARVLGANPAGSATLNVSTTNGFALSNLVLVITMQDTNQNLNNNTAGTYEFGRIASLGSGSLTLTAPRRNAFTVTAADKAIQVLKVPEYTDVTLAGAALSLDGTTASYVIVSNFAGFPTDAITAEFWMRGRAGATRDTPFSYATKASFNSFLVTDYNSNGKLGVFVAEHWLESTISPYDGNWHHIAITWRSSDGRAVFYKDGAPQFTNNVAVGQTLGGTGTLVLGQEQDSLGDGFQGDQSFLGELDEVRIWNGVRNSEAITNNMRRVLTGEEPGLVAYYRFNEGAGTKAYDATPNHLDATLVATTCVPPAGSLTCHPWNGTHGGVLAFLARSVTLGSQGIISADGKGYRGGAGVDAAGGDYAWGMAGERTTGFSTARETDCLERLQGGGGAGRGADGSGGGGGHASTGMCGAAYLGSSDYGRGAGTLYGSNTLSRLYPGGGGGGAGSHNNYRIGVGGGAGGGIVFVGAGAVAGDGTISSCGAQGTNGVGHSDANSGAGGGGGAGGSIYLVGNLSSSLVVCASGGVGGVHAPGYKGMDGGAGGVGRIRLDMPASGLALTKVSPAPGCLAQLSASNSVTALFWGGYLDSDHDGLNDWDELARGTNPMKPDTDGDGMSDGWEVAHSLNPLDATDAAQDSDGDGVPNVVEFQRGTNPNLADSDSDGLNDYRELFIYHSNPNNPDTDGDGINDGVAVAAGLDPRSSGPLPAGDRYYYDALDRLVGVDYTNGLSLAYAYDGNDNLVRQAYLSRDANTNGLPDAWELSRGLTNGIFADSDGDGATDGQEWWAGTDPWNAGSVPLDPLGPAGSNITAGIVFPFTPSNCVVAVGQLDGIGAEEIVVSADGDPGTASNFLLILSQSAAGWTTQRVDVGKQGVTSLAVGRPANRDVPAIYAGLRKAGGKGTVVEFFQAGGIWVSNGLATTSANKEAAFVLGVRPGRDVVVSMASSNAPPGTPSYLGFAANSWTLTQADTNTSCQRGLGAVSLPGLTGVASRGVRMLDAGGLQVLGDEAFVPANSIWNPAYSRWFFQTTNATTWDACQSYAQLCGGNLATISDTNLDGWLWDNFRSHSFWIGLHQVPPQVGPWVWASGLPVTYTHWQSDKETNQANQTACAVYSGSNVWVSANPAANYFGVAEVACLNGPSLTATEPPLFSRLPSRGQVLCAGDLRLTDALSIFYATVADTNRDYVVDSGDDLMLTEYLFTGTSLVANGSTRVPLAGATLASSIGLACVDVLYGNQQVLFTAEPDGCIYSWSATNASAPLTRQLFSRHDQGLAWHALAAAKTLAPGRSLLGLRVDPATPNRCDVILWPPVSQLSASPDYPQTAPITQILPVPSSGTNLARVTLCLWDGEADPARVTLQYQRPYETTWLPATIDPAGYLPTYPTGVTHTVIWNAALDLGAGFANAVQLRARAQDVSLAGDWSGPVTYQVQTVVGNDPHAYDDSAITAMNQWVDIGVLANDTVENSAPKFIYSVGTPAHGTAATNLNRTVRYTPAAGFVGTDQFIYWLTDGAAYSQATVTVTVTPGFVVLEAPALNTNWFSLLITGPPGTYQVLASTNLISWSNAAWVTNTGGSVPFAELVPTNVPARFYRALLVP